MTSEQETAMYDQPDPTDDEREALIALKLVFFSKRMDDGYPSTVIRDNEEAADLVLAAGFHRTVQAELSRDREAQGMSEAEDYARDTEPSKRAETVDDFMTGWRTADRTRVQGEPSDAVVKAAWQAYAGELIVGSGDGDDAMRAALIAAAAVQGGETR